MPFRYAQSVEDLERELQTNIQTGLTSEEAAERLKKYGPNKFEEQKKASIWKMLWEQINSVLIWILIVAAGISAIVGEETDAIIILLVVALNAVIGVVQESKAEKALEELKKMSSPKALVRRDGKTVEIATEEIVLAMLS